MKKTQIQRTNNNVMFTLQEVCEICGAKLGELSLQVPQVRSSEFYPSFLEKGSALNGH